MGNENTNPELRDKVRTKISATALEMNNNTLDSVRLEFWQKRPK